MLELVPVQNENLTENNRILGRLAAIRAELPLLNDIAEVKRIVVQAEAIRYLASKAGCEEAVQNEAAKSVIRTKHRLGELLAEMPKAPAGRPIIGSTMEPINAVPTLADLGIPKTASHRAQVIASVPSVRLESIMASLVDEGEVTQAAVIQAIENTRGGMKQKESKAADIYVPQGYDGCQTPWYALDPLVPFLTDKIIWEPALDEGLLAEAFYDYSLGPVVVSDIRSDQNFFDYEPAEQWDVLVTNPPYSIKYQWLERCYVLGKPFALLVPVETIGASTAQSLMKQYGFEIMLLDQRVDFKMPNKEWEGTAQFATMWLCWNLLPCPVMFGSIEAAKRKFKAERPAAAPTAAAGASSSLFDDESDE